MITSLENHFKSWRPDSLMYLDQSALQVINVIRRYRQRPRRVLLLRAIEGLAIVIYNHPDYLLWHASSSTCMKQYFGEIKNEVFFKERAFL